MSTKTSGQMNDVSGFQQRFPNVQFPQTFNNPQDVYSFLHSQFQQPQQTPQLPQNSQTASGIHDALGNPNGTHTWAGGGPNYTPLAGLEGIPRGLTIAATHTQLPQQIMDRYPGLSSSNTTQGSPSGGTQSGGMPTTFPGQAPVPTNGYWAGGGTGGMPTQMPPQPATQPIPSPSQQAAGQRPAGFFDLYPHLSPMAVQLTRGQRPY